MKIIGLEKMKRADEHLVKIEDSTYSNRASRGKANVEQRNLDRCQSSVESDLGRESEYRTTHIISQTEVHDE